jgi:hypothetical protein
MVVAGGSSTGSLDTLQAGDRVAVAVALGSSSLIGAAFDWAILTITK